MMADTKYDSKIWRTLACAVSGRETSLEDFEGEEVLRHAAQNGISQLLDSQVRAGTVAGLSEQVKQQLGASSKRQAVLDLLLNDATGKTLKFLTEGEVPVLLLKGTPIAHLYYDDTWQRPRCDTDLYIDHDQVDKAALLLSDHGYQVSGLGTREYSSKQFGASTAPFQKIGLQFDVHWKLSNRVMFRRTLPFDQCRETSQAVPALGPEARTLSITNLLLHACIHRIAHGRNTEHNRLIWLYDINLLIQAMNETEVSEFQARAIERKVGAVCADALDVSHDLFSTTLPPDLVQQLKSNARKEPSAKLIHASKLRWAWEDMQALENLQQKIAFVRELLFK